MVVAQNTKAFPKCMLETVKNCLMRKPKVRIALGLASNKRAKCSSVVRAFAHGAMGRRIDPSWGEPTELFLVPPSAP